MPVNRRPSRVSPFMEQEIIAKWLPALQSKRTKVWYSYNLQRFLASVKLTPKEFLDKIERDPKAASIETKSTLTSLKSKARAKATLSAIRSFTEFYETPLHTNGLKMRVPRTRRKIYLSWSEADKIVLETHEPYRSLLRFLQWSGLGLDELAEIQHSSEIQRSIEKQRGNDKPYVRIDLRPRKMNLDQYYALVPKEYVPQFPLKTYEYKDRGGQLITNNAVESVWHRARVRARINEIGLGPHTLRSCFRSACAKAGVNGAVAEFQMGHGSQDAYGYSREVQDESYVASELSKLWKASIVVTSDQLEERDRQIQQLRKELNEIRATDIEQQIEAAESEIKSGLPNLLEDGEISEDEYKTRVADVQEEIRKLREELKNLKV